jgi:four helix bundle protein
MSGSNYRDLTVWRKGMDLVVEVYQLSQSFPKEELYGLTSQIRRAAVSIPSNIAEGQGQGSDRGFSRFLSIAQGSLTELETQLMIAQRLEYLDDLTCQSTLDQCAEIGRMLNGLQRSVKARF